MEHLAGLRAGPVESQAVDDSVGVDPSVVYLITAGSSPKSNVVSIGCEERVTPVIRTCGARRSFS